MVQHMIADPDYARDYFLNGDEIKLTSLSCAKVAKGAYTDLKECTEEDIRTLMYEYFCWNNDSKKLESYKGTGSKPLGTYAPEKFICKKCGHHKDYHH